MLTNRFRFSALGFGLGVFGWALTAAAQGTPAEPDADAEVGAEPPPSSAAPPAAAAPSAPPAPAASAAPSAPAAPPTEPPSTSAPAGATTGAAAAANTSAATTAPAAPPAPAAPAEPWVDIGGYAQVEFQSHKDSEDQLNQGNNAPLNQNRFLVRRARLIAKRAWKYTSLELELDGNTVSGPAFSLYRAEASAYYRPDTEKPPLIQLTMGLFRLPFGAELPESARDRWFMERTQMSRAFFPTEIDLGGRLSGGYGPFRVAAALTNGEPAGEKTGFALQDPNRAKDLTISAGAQGSPLDALTISGDVSVITGHGFHAGSGATKNVISWNNLNEDGNVDSDELNGLPARNAIKSQSFERWGVGANIKVDVATPIGKTSLLGELVAAKNLDRGYFPADPVSAGKDLREFGYYLGLLQEITPYAIVGFRVDFYDPNADSTDTRAGKTLPAKNTVTTYSPLVGVTLPKRARLLFQYDIIKDYLARDTSGVPTNLDNNAWTLRLQVSL